MVKSAALVWAIALAIIHIVYGDSGGCEIPKTARGAFKDESLGDWEVKWSRFNYERVIYSVEIESGIIVPSGKVLWFYCDEAYSVNGSGKHKEQIRCLSGRWSSELQCLRDIISCPEFTLTPGLNVTYSKDLSVGSVASFECSLSTKDLNGSNFSTCQENGRWSNPLPSCEDQKCSIHDLGVSVPEEAELDMSAVTEEHVILGFEVKLKCAFRYLITGDSKARCEKQGRWKLGRFNCVPRCVLNLVPSSHLIVLPKQEVYRMGELIRLLCPPGEELSSNVVQLMCLSGKWSDPFPYCIEPKKKPRL